MLRTVRTVIVDEIHAVAGDKRGAHLALSLERLEALGRVSAAAAHRPLGDAEADRGRGAAPGRRRPRRASWSTSATAATSISPSRCPTRRSRRCARTRPGTRSSQRMAELIRAHRTTLVFVNTRKLAERVAARLTEALGEDQVTSHHGSLSRERRLDAEDAAQGAASCGRWSRPPRSSSGIDIGDVDLVIQVGITAVDRHLPAARRPQRPRARRARPRAGIFPLTEDELVLRGRAARRGAPRRARPHAEARAPARHPRPADRRRLRRRDLGRGRALRDAAPRLALPRPRRARTSTPSSRCTPTGAHALLHRDGVHGRLRATRRARITALTSGGAIPDTGQYRVVLEPEGIAGRLARRGLRDRVQRRRHLPARQRVVARSSRSSPAWCASPTRTARRRRCRSGSARRRRARASCRRRSRASARTGAIPRWLDARGRARRPRAADAARRLPEGGRAHARRDPDARVRRARALLRRIGRHAARAPRAVRRPHQPRLGPGAAQALLPRLRLRAPGGGERGGDRPLARAPAQLPARGGVRLPASRTPRTTCWSRRCSPRRCSARAGAGT